MPKLPQPLNAGPPAPIARPAVLLERAKQKYLQGEREESIKLFRQILQVDTMNGEAAGLLGMTLLEDKQALLALEHFENALRIDPEQYGVWLGRGMALADTGRFTDALASFDRALALEPLSDLAKAHRAATLFRLGRFDDARAVAGELVARHPDDAGQANGYALILQFCGRNDEAAKEYERALALNPEEVTAHTNRGMFLMQMGDLQAGHREYEWRWRLDGDATSGRAHTRPLWTGEQDISGKTLLIYYEQGYGDTLQFCRYAIRAAKAGARVIIEVQKQLKQIMMTLPLVSHVITETDELPEHDLRCPMLSLPLAFGTTLETIPTEIPYLHADPVRVAAWRERIATISRPRVGIVWAGSSRFGSAELMATDQRRSMPLAAFAPVAAVEGCSFVSLQVGPQSGQAKSPPANMVLHDHTDELHDFAETAALIENLDLVISADTAVLHLAGAMGKPVWLLNRFDTCWRWFENRDDSPWYPTLRQFRQTSSGDWDGVAVRVAGALRDFVATHRAQDGET